MKHKHKIHESRLDQPPVHIEHNQDFTNPGAAVGSARVSPSIRALGTRPVLMVLLGMAGALAVFVALAVTEFQPIHIAYYLPGILLSAVLIYGGAKKLKRE